jgi:hypothetical protein
MGQCTLDTKQEFNVRYALDRILLCHPAPVARYAEERPIEVRVQRQRASEDYCRDRDPSSGEDDPHDAARDLDAEEENGECVHSDDLGAVVSMCRASRMQRINEQKTCKTVLRNRDTMGQSTSSPQCLPHVGRLFDHS